MRHSFIFVFLCGCVFGGLLTWISAREADFLESQTELQTQKTLVSNLRDERNHYYTLSDSYKRTAIFFAASNHATINCNAFLQIGEDLRQQLECEAIEIGVTTVNAILPTGERDGLLE